MSSGAFASATHGSRDRLGTNFKVQASPIPAASTCTAASSGRSFASSYPPYEEAAISPATSPEENAEEARQSKTAVVDALIQEDDLYRLLGVRPQADMEEIRHAFLKQSRLCHPDKFPDYPPSTLAFQKVSYAYETLSKPESRRRYDVCLYHKSTNTAHNYGSEEDLTGEGPTLGEALQSLLGEFPDGDFDMVSTIINALKEGSGLNFDDDAIEFVEGLLRQLRLCTLSVRTSLFTVQTELDRLLELLTAMRKLPYFDFFGRLRLALQMTRIAFGILIALDLAMSEGTVTREKLDSVPPAGQVGFTMSDLEGGLVSSSSFGGADPPADKNSELKQFVRDGSRQPQNQYTASYRHLFHAANSNTWGLLGPTGLGALNACVSALKATENWLSGCPGGCS